MNSHHLLLILFKSVVFNELFVVSVAIRSEVKRLKKDKSMRVLHPNVHNYVYLNYKETYGLRFDPKKLHKKRLANETSEGAMTTEALPVTMMSSSSAPQTTPVVTTMGSDEMTTASPTTSEISVPTSTTSTIPVENGMSSTESSKPYQQKILSFSTLRNRGNVSKQQNTTIQRLKAPSSLKETLQFIRKRLKQWLLRGTDPKASLLNGQRFLNVFNVIKFENSPCTSALEGLTEMSGICYHDYQCTQMGGTSIDECADGLGVCCVFKTGCGQTTNQLDSYFQNPGWPEASQDRLICTLSLDLQDDVAQVRFDFISFELKPPTDGNCEDDQFLVAGQNLNNIVPAICGVNSGQHIYVEVDNAMDRRLYISILTSSVAARAFNIRVQQLKNSLAPVNCLQYYTDTVGWFQTFNYDDTSQFVTNRVPSYFNNLNYVICIKRQWNYCSTTYSNEADDVEYDFQLINIDSEGTSVVPEKQAGIEIFSCNDDYISVNSIRLCGEKLNDASRNDDLTVNSVIIDTSNGLNVIPVRTNANAVGRGFRINYVQIPCEDQPVTTESVTESTEEVPTDDEVVSNKYRRT